MCFSQQMTGNSESVFFFLLSFKSQNEPYFEFEIVVPFHPLQLSVLLMRCRHFHLKVEICLFFRLCQKQLRINTFFCLRAQVSKQLQRFVVYVRRLSVFCIGSWEKQNAYFHFIHNKTTFLLTQSIEIRAASSRDCHHHCQFKSVDNQLDFLSGGLSFKRRRECSFSAQHK